LQYQWDNLVLSSFLLWLDNQILTKGTAYTNIDSKLYPAGTTFNGYYQYNFPFSQLVSDTGVPGANIPTGLYLNSFFAGVGTSGLAGINYYKGQAYFSTALASTVQVSGQYAVKDINIVLDSSPDISVLFETKLNLRDKFGRNANNFTGIANSEMSYPAIFCRQVGSSSEAFAMGGLKDTKNNIGCYIFCDSRFLLDAATSIIRDRKHDYIPLLEANEFPFNNFGGFKNNIPYNYTGITANKVANGSGLLVTDVIITDFSRKGLFSEVQAITTDAYFSVAEFELSKPRLT